MAPLVCKFESIAKGVRCIYCGRILDHGNVKIIAQCRSKNYTPVLLGDRIEIYLKSIGVTPENYAYGKEIIGLLPSCGCKGRRRAFNDIHTHAKKHGWLSAVRYAKRLWKEAHNAGQNNQ